MDFLKFIKTKRNIHTIVPNFWKVTLLKFNFVILHEQVTLMALMISNNRFPNSGHHGIRIKKQKHFLFHGPT